MAKHKTVGAHLVESLQTLGVRHVFGIPGVHNLELYRGLAASQIRHVAGRHEQGLGFMADGYARVSGRPGVCLTITGPGLTNIASAMAQAYGDSIPLVVISSENRRQEIGTGRGFLHELPNQQAIGALVSGRAFRVDTPEALGPVLTEVFSGASAKRPRPAYVEIPRDVLTEAADGLPTAEPVSVPAVNGAPASQVTVAAQWLRSARSPLLLVGGGAIRAGTAVRRLAEHLGAPVVMTVNARGLLPVGHPLAVSASPSLATVRELIASADLVLAVGTEIGPTDYDMYALSDFPKPARLLRIDIDAQQMRRSALPDLELLGDATATLEAILALDLGQATPERGVAAARAAASAALLSLTPAMQREVSFLNVIRECLPEAIVVGDSTQPVYAGNLYYESPRPGAWFNSSTGFGTLGYALPASTGAGLAAPDRPIVCLVGDGGIQFSLGELAVPRDVNAWSAIIVWNNQGYGEIRSSMLAVDIEPEGVDIRPPNFEPIAQAYGYGYRQVDSLVSLERTLSDFGTRRQVLLIEINAKAFE
jgi:acetolactate synthase-1/2/3 large subunit